MSELKEKLASGGGAVVNGNGHANGNGHKNGDTVGGKIFKESGAFILAEGASIITGLGVVAVADKIIPESIMKSASKTIAKVAIEPFLDNIESARDKLCKLDECKTDYNVPREERAEQLAKTMIVFGAAYVASMAMKLWVRRKLTKFAGVHEEKPAPLAQGAGLWDKVKYYGKFQFVTPQEKLIFAADEGVHYGSMWLLNSPLAPYTDSMITGTTNMLDKIPGVDRNKAHQLADMFWIWDAPNILGGLAGIGVIAGNHAFNLSNKGWLGKLLANKTPAETTSQVEKLALRNAAAANMQHTLSS